MNAKLQLGLRAHEGKKRLSAFLTDIVRDLGQSSDDIQLLDLTTTDQFWKLFLQQSTAVKQGTLREVTRRWKADEQEAMRVTFTHLAANAQNEKVILFRRQSEYCGALFVMSQVIFQRALAFHDLHDEYVQACTADGTYGIVFDMNVDWTSSGEEIVYDLKIWGDQWVTILESII